MYIHSFMQTLMNVQETITSACSLVSTPMDRTSVPVRKGSPSVGMARHVTVGWPADRASFRVRLPHVLSLVNSHLLITY